MDEIRENKLTYRRRIENIIKNVEETEAKTNEAIRTKLESNSKSIGPANDLLRFLYILEQQYQTDSDEIRTKARENVLEYIDQFRSPEDVEEEEEEEEDNNTDQQSNGPQQPTPIIPLNPQPTMIMPQQPTVAPYSPAVGPSPPQPTMIMPQQPTAAPYSPVVGPSPPQPSSSGKPQASSLIPVTNSEHIKPETFNAYQKLLAEAQQYENRYKIIDPLRRKQQAARIKDYTNKLRKDSFKGLTTDLYEFLNGAEQIIANQRIRILNEEERLLCLSMLATSIFNQFLAGDLDEKKAEIFVPLIANLSENERHKEFRTIFLDRLHKKCPYTVPFYPERKPTMNDKQYYEAMGYIEKKEGDQNRLETETEFLNRMSGLIRLFCKLLVRRGPPFDNDLKYAWAWFADVLNLLPRPNITALLVRLFIDEAGESMMKEYPKSFPNLIQFIHTQYLSKLEKVTSDDQMARLRLALENLQKKF